LPAVLLSQEARVVIKAEIATKEAEIVVAEEPEAEITEEAATAVVQEEVAIIEEPEETVNILERI